MTEWQRRTASSSAPERSITTLSVRPRQIVRPRLFDWSSYTHSRARHLLKPSPTIPNRQISSGFRRNRETWVHGCSCGPIYGTPPGENPATSVVPNGRVPQRAMPASTQSTNKN